MVRLGSEAHGSTVGATSAGLLVIGTGSVPGETDEDGAVAAIIVVVLLLEAGGNLVVDGLVVLELGSDNLGGGGRAVLVEIPETTGTESTSTNSPGPDVGTTGLGGLRRVEATTTLLESSAGRGSEGRASRGAQSAESAGSSAGGGHLRGGRSCQHRRNSQCYHGESHCGVEGGEGIAHHGHLRSSEEFEDKTRADS